MYSSELWNHYAAAVLKTRLPYTSVPTIRGRRLQGDSRMGFVSLAVHGLSALSVFSDTLGVRLLVASVAGLGSLMVLLLFVALWQWHLRRRPTQRIGDHWRWYVPRGLRMVTACGLLALVVLVPGGPAPTSCRRD